MTAEPERDISEMRVIDVRAAIAHRVGLKRNHRSGLGILDLNSIYRHLSGEFWFHSKLYRTQKSPSLKEMRMVVALESGIETYPVNEDTAGRPYRRSELKTLLEAVDEIEEPRAALLIDGEPVGEITEVRYATGSSDGS